MDGKCIEERLKVDVKRTKKWMEDWMDKKNVLWMDEKQNEGNAWNCSFISSYMNDSMNGLVNGLVSEWLNDWASMHIYMNGCMKKSWKVNFQI